MGGSDELLSDGLGYLGQKQLVHIFCTSGHGIYFSSEDPVSFLFGLILRERFCEGDLLATTFDPKTFVCPRLFAKMGERYPSSPAAGRSFVSEVGSSDRCDLGTYFIDDRDSFWS